MHINKSTRLQLQLQRWLFTALLLCVAGMLSWITNRYYHEYDWTANARNSLSQSSIELLQTLKDPVVVHVYAQQDSTLRQAVEEILQRYQRVKSDFSYRLLNPDIDIEQAGRDAVKSYGEVVISYQGRKESIASLAEQTISSALLRLSRATPKQLVFISGHGERSTLQEDNRGYSTLAAQLGNKGFTVTRLNLLQQALSADTSAVIIAAPGNALLPGEREQIENYITAGGNLLWLIDPGQAADLESLAQQLGIKLQTGIVVDNNTNLRETLQIEHPAIIPVLEYFPHAITRSLDYNTLFPIARGIEFDSTASSDWHHSELLRSFQRSWSETGALGESITFNSSDGDIAGPITLGVTIERVLGADANAVAAKASQRIVVIGDSDFLANSYIGAGANLALGMNLFNWLAGDDDLIAVELKAAPDTQLQLSDTAVLFIGVGFFLALPAALFTTGMVIWIRRRRR